MKLTTTNKLILGFMLSTLLSTAIAREISALSTISFVNTYDLSTTIYFKLTSPSPTCEGYFIDNGTNSTAPNNIGYDINVSSILAAFHGRKEVIVHGDPAELWGGSSSIICRLKVLRVMD